MKRSARVRIGPDDAGRSVLDFLCRRFTYHDRTEWDRLIRDGCILLDGRTATRADLLQTGDTLEYLVPARPEPDVDTAYRIVHEDADLLAIDKPGNLPCHPAGCYFNHTLWALLKTARPDQHLEFMNRLDRETSGIVLIAKSAEAGRHCRRQFERREVRKRYLVLVEGAFPAELAATGVLVADSASPVRKKRKLLRDGIDLFPEDVPASSRAQTRFRLVDHHGALSLVEALPKTGRLHQIRASLCSLGFPVGGDKIYGPDDTLFLRFIAGELTQADRQTLRLPRQALHAADLELHHPDTGEPIALHAPLPPDMAALLD